MPEGRPKLTLILSIVGSILVLLNGSLLVMNNAPVIASPFPVSSAEEAMASRVSWWRIVFGIPGLVENYQSIFWLVFAGVMLLSAFLIYERPRKCRTYSLWITISSLLCIPIGGGFYLGTVLGFIGGLSGMESPKPFRETFLGRIIRGVTLDSKVYVLIRDNPTILRTAALVVISVGILRGIGNGLYTYNVNLIRNGGPPASGILLNGQVIWHSTAILTALSLIGISILEWLILSLAIYWIGAKLAGIPMEYDKIVRVSAFAYVPVGLQFVAPLMFSNEPTLSFGWPFGLYLISHLWVFIALIVATEQMFDFPRMKALGLVVLSGMIYWIVDNMLLIPTLNVPGIVVVLSTPTSSLFILLSLSAATIIAALLGVFTRR